MMVSNAGKNEKGAILVVAMVLVAVVGLFCTTIYDIPRFAIKQEQIAHTRNKNLLFAHSMMDKEKNQIYSIFLDYYDVMGDYGWFDVISADGLTLGVDVNSLGCTYAVPVDEHVDSSIQAPEAIKEIENLFYSVEVHPVTTTDAIKTQLGVINDRRLLYVAVNVYYKDSDGIVVDNSQKTVEEIIQFGDAPSEAYKNAYFVRDVLMLEGSQLTVNGNLSSNGDVDLSKLPTINGDIMATGIITNDHLDKHETASNYAGVSMPDARPLVTN